VGVAYKWPSLQVSMCKFETDLQACPVGNFS